MKVDESELEEIAKQESEKTGISTAKLIKYYKDTNRIDVLLEEKLLVFLKRTTRQMKLMPTKKLKRKRIKKNDE